MHEKRVIEFKHEYLQHQIKQYNLKDISKFVEEMIGIRCPLLKNSKCNEKGILIIL